MKEATSLGLCRALVQIREATERGFAADTPGHYRLRAVTADLAGRSTVVSKTFDVGGPSGPGGGTG